MSTSSEGSTTTTVESMTDPFAEEPSVSSASYIEDSDQVTDLTAVSLVFKCKPEELIELQSIYDTLLEPVSCEDGLIEYSTTDRPTMILPQSMEQNNQGGVVTIPSLSVIIFLQESDTVDDDRLARAREVFRSDPWRWHHSESVSKGKINAYPDNTLDYFFVDENLPLWSVRQVHTGKEFVRVMKYVSHDLWQDSINLHTLLLGKHPDISRADFVAYSVSGRGACDMQLALKKLPERVLPNKTDRVLLKIYIQDLGQLVPLLPNACFPVDTDLWITQDLDGNEMLLDASPLNQSRQNATEREVIRLLPQSNTDKIDEDDTEVYKNVLSSKVQISAHPVEFKPSGDQKVHNMSYCEPEEGIHTQVNNDCTYENQSARSDEIELHSHTLNANQKVLNRDEVSSVKTGNPSAKKKPPIPKKPLIIKKPVLSICDKKAAGTDTRGTIDTISHNKIALPDHQCNRGPNNEFAEALSQTFHDSVSLESHEAASKDRNEPQSPNRSVGHTDAQLCQNNPVGKVTRSLVKDKIQMFDKLSPRACPTKVSIHDRIPDGKISVEEFKESQTSRQYIDFVTQDGKICIEEVIEAKSCRQYLGIDPPVQTSNWERTNSFKLAIDNRRFYVEDHSEQEKSKLKPLGQCSHPLMTFSEGESRRNESDFGERESISIMGGSHGDEGHQKYAFSRHCQYRVPIHTGLKSERSNTGVKDSHTRARASTPSPSRPATPALQQNIYTETIQSPAQQHILYNTSSPSSHYTHQNINRQSYNEPDKVYPRSLSIQLPEDDQSSVDDSGVSLSPRGLDYNRPFFDNLDSFQTTSGVTSSRLPCAQQATVPHFTFSDTESLYADEKTLDNRIPSYPPPPYKPRVIKSALKSGQSKKVKQKVHFQLGFYI